MSKFHSAVSRRDFVKMIATTTGAVGAAAAVIPVFHDVDELMSSVSGQKRAWYVKERDFYNPTVEVDWDVMGRRDPTHSGHSPEDMAYYHGQDRYNNSPLKGEQWLAERNAANAPGFTYRARALKEAEGTTWPTRVSQTFGGLGWRTTAGSEYKGVETPEERGEPKWSGTPEENSLMMTAFMKFNGSALNGYGELDTRMRTQVISKCAKFAPKKPLIFEDVDRGYDTTDKYVVPSKPMWYFSNFELENIDVAKCTPAFGGILNNSDFSAATLKPSTMMFLRYLGYQMIGGGSDNSIPFVEGAVSTLTGVTEGSRNNNYVLTPEYGAIGRLHSYITDMPLAPTKPIDAGMFRFCHDCHKCANACPAEAICQDKEPSWDMRMINGKLDMCHNIGTKEFWMDAPGCRVTQRETGHTVDHKCRICFGACTFTVGQGAMVHELIKSIIPTTSVFNGFFYQMGETFGYGQSDQKAEDWWDGSFPILGIDTSRVAYSGYHR